MKTSHYLLARLVVQKLVDNQVLLCSSSERVYCQGKAGYLIEFLKWAFLKHWQMCIRRDFAQTVIYKLNRILWLSSSACPFPRFNLTRYVLILCITTINL